MFFFFEKANLSFEEKFESLILSYCNRNYSSKCNVNRYMRIYLRLQVWSHQAALAMPPLVIWN